MAGALVSPKGITKSNARPFISKVASFYSLKILSTKEGQRGILKWLSLTPSTIR